MWIDNPPARCHPLIEGDDGALSPDTSVTVELYPLRPDLVDQFVAWSDGEQLFIGGAPVVLLSGTQKAAQRLVGLGDYAARDESGRLRAESAAGIATRYSVAEA